MVSGFGAELGLQSPTSLVESWIKPAPWRQAARASIPSPRPSERLGTQVWLRPAWEQRPRQLWGSLAIGGSRLVHVGLGGPLG